MRIKTADDAEYRFWLTRRYVKLLWPVVRRMLETDQQVAVQEDPVAKSAVLSFQHEEALKKSDFATQFNEETSALPLGKTPIVLAKIQLKHRQDGINVLCMHPEKGEGIELAMNKLLLHSFSKLLSDAVAGAEWDIKLQVATDNDVPERVPDKMN